MIEGDRYTVHDTAGLEVPRYVDKTTKLAGPSRSAIRLKSASRTRATHCPFSTSPSQVEGWPP